MMEYEQLMTGLIRFGRGNVQDLIVRSNDVNDAGTYLWAELALDLARVSSFQTTNLITFEKKEFLKYTLYQAKNQDNQSISQNITLAKNKHEEV